MASWVQSADSSGRVVGLMPPSSAARRTALDISSSSRASAGEPPVPEAAPAVALEGPLLLCVRNHQVPARSESTITSAITSSWSQLPGLAAKGPLLVMGWLPGGYGRCPGIRPRPMTHGGRVRAPSRVEWTDAAHGKSSLG